MIQAVALKEGHFDIFSLLPADKVLSPFSADNTDMCVKITLKKKTFSVRFVIYCVYEVLADLKRTIESCMLLTMLESLVEKSCVGGVIPLSPSSHLPTFS